MKHQTTSSNSSPTKTDRKRIDRVFLSFSAFYGQLWRSQFKSDEFLEFMKNEWFYALQHIEDKHMNEAIIQCRQTKEYPPTLPLFVELCQSAKKRDAMMKKAPENTVRNTHSEVARHHLKQIKALLRG